VDVSSTGTRVPSIWVLLRAHDSEEATHADDYHDRSRYREVRFLGSWRRADGNVVLRRQLKRRYLVGSCSKSSLIPMTIGSPICAVRAHHLAALFDVDRIGRAGLAAIDVNELYSQGSPCSVPTNRIMATKGSGIERLNRSRWGTAVNPAAMGTDERICPMEFGSNG
jgi:hypothetical protein